MLGRELRGGCDLDALGLLERALGEGREEGQALDLDVEELAAHRALLGGRIDVEDVAADGELAALLDLLDALVAAGHELGPDLVEVHELAGLEREAVRTQLGVGHLLRERGDRGDDHRGGVADARGRADARTSGVEQGVERRDPQPDEMRWGREVRLVLDSPCWVEPDRPWAQERPQIGGQVARGAVVAGDHESGPPGLEVEQGGEQVRAHAARHERALGRLASGLGQGRDRRVIVGVGEELSQRHGMAKAARGGSHGLAGGDSRTPAEAAHRVASAAVAAVSPTLAERAQAGLLHALAALPRPAKRALAGRPTRADGQEMDLDTQVLLRLLERVPDPPKASMTPQATRERMRRITAVIGRGVRPWKRCRT